jgi:UMP-CMP kinase
MVDRIVERSKTSGRADDNKESLAKRFVTFEETSMPVVDHYRALGLCVNINSTPVIQEVYAQVKSVLAERLPAITA